MSRIGNPSLTWNEQDIPFSQGFEDIYYKADGLSETRVVFLEGNNLPNAWVGQKQFTICETGFGTGLNFLSAWKLFDETTSGDERLDFISFEQFPLSKDDLQRSLKRLEDAFGAERIKRFVDIYPPRIPSFHRRHISDRVTLTLIFDDALRGLKQLSSQVDAWFLDGFNPAKNTALWHADLFKEMARLSHAKTTLSSYTAVTAIREELNAAGFEIERVKGFGYKKHRIIGRFLSERPKATTETPKNIRIIGAGLAGAGVAYALRRRGISAEVFDQNAHIAAGASGNHLGLINPKIEAQDNPRTDAGLAAFSFATHVLNDVPDIDYAPTGALHLAIDMDKHERLEKLYRNASWLAPHMRWVKAAEAKEICGIALKHDGLFYPDAASVNTQKLVHELLRGTVVDFHSPYTPYPDTPTVLACGWGLHTLPETKALPLQPVRGQITYIQAPATLKCPVLFGSYAAPVSDGTWALGATFEQNQTENILQESATIKNLAQAQQFLGIENPSVTGEWSNIRTASRDRFPIVGEIDDHLFVSGALGSHGIQFGLLLGEIIACMLTGAPMPIGKDALQALSIKRFY